MRDQCGSFPIQINEKFGILTRADAIGQDVTLQSLHVPKADAVLRADLAGEIGKEIIC